MAACCVGDYVYYFSAQLAASLQYLAANNSGVPSRSPSNKDLKITGTYNKAGDEIILDMDEANDYCNACGVVTAINMNGWKAGETIPRLTRLRQIRSTDGSTL